MSCSAYSVFLQLVKNLGLDSFPYTSQKIRSEHTCSKTKSQRKTAKQHVYHENEALTGDRDEPKWFLIDCLSPWACKETWSDQISVLQQLALRDRKAPTIEVIRSNLNSLRIVNKKVTHVDPNMRLFPNVTIFVLSGNLLEQIDGRNLPPKVTIMELGFNQLNTLETLVSVPLSELKYLGLCHNNVGELSSCITYPRLPNIIHLDLSFNDLVALDSVINVLKYLAALRTLLLLGNPLVLVPGYRGYIVSQLPVLKTLDDRMIQWEERQQYQKWVNSGRQFIIDHAILSIEVLGVLNVVTMATIATSMQTADLITGKDPKKPLAPLPKDEWLYYVEYAYPIFTEGSDELTSKSPQVTEAVVNSSVGLPSFNSSWEGNATILDFLSSTSNADQHIEMASVHDRVIHSTGELPWADMICFEDTLTVTYTNLRGLKKFFENTLTVRLVEDYIQYVPRGLSIISVRGDKNKNPMEAQFERLPNSKSLKACFTADMVKLLMGESELFIIYNQSKNPQEAELVKDNVREIYAAIRDKLRKHDRKMGASKQKQASSMPSPGAPVYKVDSIPHGTNCYMVVSLFRQSYTAPYSTKTDSVTSVQEGLASVCARL